MPLLENKFAPTTFCIGFLEADIGSVSDTDLTWRKSIGRYHQKVCEGDIEALLTELEPLSGPLTRYLWVSTSARWTAYFDNFINGSDPFGPISYLSKEIGCRGLVVSCSPEVEGHSYGQTRFDLYGQQPVDFLNCSRSIASTNDGGRWSWEVSGDILDFEEPDNYGRRDIKNRLTMDMISRYCSAVGVELFNDEFYGTGGILVDNQMIEKSDCRTMSYSEARIPYVN